MMNLAFEDKSIFKLGICVAKWDVLMKEYFVKNAGVVHVVFWPFAISSS